RTALRPMNPPAILPTKTPQKTQNPKIRRIDGSNKENFPAADASPPSLAEELMVVREKLERQRADKETTEKLLRQRMQFLDSQMKEVLRRGELQKEVEMEVDRLYRLREIKLACVKITPIRSLREREVEKQKQNQQ
ncbi:hypothetical protein M569_01637, partial [Genlisea aurea]